jgi:hypothetical protein
MLGVGGVLGSFPCPVSLHADRLLADEKVQAASCIPGRPLGPGVADAERDHLKLGSSVVDEIHGLSADDHHVRRRGSRSPAQNAEEGEDEDPSRKTPGNLPSTAHGNGDLATVGGRKSNRGTDSLLFVKSNKGTDDLLVLK